jgi:DNA replicative helicase MCM subunit Mcm2 (Cdc46/Mcm family)
MIKMEYLLENGKEAVEGTTVIECKKCHRKFAVPVGESNLIVGKVCEECASKEAAEAAVEMKVEKPAELKAALGE